MWVWSMKTQTNILVPCPTVHFQRYKRVLASKGQGGFIDTTEQVVTMLCLIGTCSWWCLTLFTLAGLYLIVKAPILSHCFSWVVKPVIVQFNITQYIKQHRRFEFVNFDTLVFNQFFKFNLKIFHDFNSLLNKNISHAR